MDNRYQLAFRFIESPFLLHYQTVHSCQYDENTAFRLPELAMEICRETL